MEFWGWGGARGEEKKKVRFFFILNYRILFDILRKVLNDRKIVFSYVIENLLNFDFNFRLCKGIVSIVL